MITLLAKLFIKDTPDVNQKRSAYGMLCGIVGIVLNIFLFIGKFIAGSLSGSIAITADAFNNLSDAGSSVVTLLGFKISGAKPDSTHPYGHGRVEYLAGFIVSAIILAMAFSLVRDAVVKIIHPQDIDFSWVIVGILVASIFVKLYMAFYNSRVGKQFHSATLRATAVDSLSDCISTFAVLVATLIAHFFSVNLDGYFGILVGGFVAFSGYSACRDTLSPLLGQAPEAEYVDRIKEITLNFDPHIHGMHDLLVHDYGPGRRFITFHAEVPAEDDVLILHDIIDNLEHVIRTELGCHCTIHLDPIVTKDERINELKEQVAAALAELDMVNSFHDFRVVFGETHTNLIFDILIPMNVKESDDEVRETVGWHVHNRVGEKYFCAIEVDRDYT